MSGSRFTFSRRAALAGGAALLASGCGASRFAGPAYTPFADNIRPQPPRPKANPPALFWRDHFSDVTRGAILVNINDRWLVYWSPGGETYDAFPIAVPLDASLTRTGLTKIVRMRENPDWRPTPSMRKRNPSLPEYVGPGPDNPLGERAMYLSWTYYAIHGTNNPASIGTAATSGCFRLHPDDVLWLYDQAKIGMPVRVVQSLDDRRARNPDA